MSRVNTGERLLSQMSENRVISPSGAAWCIIAADPYHDKELPQLCGYPDTQVGQSCVLKVPYQMNLSKPAGLPAGNWSFLLSSYPWTFGDQSSSVLSNYTTLGNLMKVNPGTSQKAFPVSIYCGADGNDLGPFNVTDVNNDPVVQGLSLDPSYTVGPNRVIGWGIEVYDTTAVINRQGSCTVWRQNTNTYDKSTYYYYTDDGAAPPNITARGSFSGNLIRRPPKNVSEANKLAGTRSWKSEDGCYLVNTLNQEDNIAKCPNDTQPIIINSDVGTGNRGASSITTISGMVASTTGYATGSLLLYPDIVFNHQPFHMSGCFFTGLSDSSSFLIRTVLYVERFPSPDEEEIVLLTKPSANHDPVALEIYDRMLKSMPVGVPVKENGLGTWFADAVRSAVPILRAIPHPFAQGAAAVGDVGLRLLGNGDNSQKQKPKTSSTPAVKTQKSVPQTKALVISPSNPINKGKPSKRPSAAPKRRK